jgi:hypothetical protein
MMSDIRFSKEGCLVDDDLYLYVSGQGSSETLGRMEDHLARCSSCRHHLAEVLEILHPKDEKTVEEISAPSEAELNETIAIIQEIARKERAAIQRPSYHLRWPLAAAASIAIFALTFWGLEYLYKIKKSEDFLLDPELSLLEIAGLLFAAAASIAIVTLIFWGLKYLYKTKKS